MSNPKQRAGNPYKVGDIVYTYDYSGERVKCRVKRVVSEYIFCENDLGFVDKFHHKFFKGRLKKKEKKPRREGEGMSEYVRLEKAAQNYRDKLNYNQLSITKAFIAGAKYWEDRILILLSDKESKNQDPLIYLERKLMEQK